jgi:hypothetical protein
MLGAFVGVFWAMLSSKIISSDNIVMRILAKLKIKNNMSEVVALDAEQNRYIDKVIDITSKSSEIANIKNNIQNFRETLEEMEVIKRAKAERNLNTSKEKNN